MRITTINEWKAINEVGDGSINPYRYTLYKKNDTSYSAIFDTEYYSYTVLILLEGPEYNRINISFYTQSGEIETNENNQYKIMSTMVAIVKEVLLKEPQINEITFIAKEKDTDTDNDDNQRLKLYLIYAKKHLGPEWTIISGTNTATIIKINESMNTKKRKFELVGYIRKIKADNGIVLLNSDLKEKTNNK